MTKVELYKSRIFVTVIHLLAVGQFSYALLYNNFEVGRSDVLKTSRSRRLIPDGFVNKSKFFTYWNLIIQSIYFTICVINDVFGTNEVSPKKTPAIRKIKDYLMASLAFPIALNVGITFWSIYAIDRELVLPKVLDAVFPSWLNHIMHTNIVVFIVLELFISYREYPPRQKGLAVLTVFLLTYLAWLHIVKHYSGVWVYPVLEVIQLPQRIIFFIVLYAFTISLYYLGEFMNNTVWAKELKLSHRKLN